MNRSSLTPSLPSTTMTAMTAMLLAGTLLLVSCSSGEEVAPENLVRKVNVQVDTLRYEDFESTFRQVGTVKSERDATLSAEVSGRLVSFPLQKGDRVRKGDVVARLDDAKLSQEVRRMEAMVNQSKETWQRQQELFDNGIGSQTELNNARYLYEQQAAALESIRIDLQNTRMRAPFDGVVEQTYAEVGELVTPGAPVLRLVNDRELKVEVGVPARFSGRIRKGDAVTVWFNNDPSSQRQASVRFVGTAVDPGNRTFQVEVVFPVTDERIKIDMVAEAEFVTQRIPGSILVSEEYLFYKGGEYVAYVASSNEAGQSVARETVVRLGPVFRNTAVIEAGLAEGDLLVTRGSSYLNEGTRIEIVN